ncbi:hypothetical protein TFKS16_0251 [Tannerella forsythia KS16]|uniref:Uncharacterized protein n=1 Tax=Tannerella forsythia (strain ATCC 43037 / JCM 10827 / CCUG 21028 A / KCTC 5666 / FDC 338) TaxID=203275 RepID=G8UJI5_TANFA|nr:hypothetical protein BFO_0258 [Tannerella forsythia 92A2]BAR47826.1 hypothetical protein TF3313_0224 [Tannerella forsythia 3313]BAR50587.1 hypothetical protein TFKS16_0251 [Tannerella forsythia KS16]
MTSQRMTSMRTGIIIAKVRKFGLKYPKAAQTSGKAAQV